MRRQLTAWTRGWVLCALVLGVVVAVDAPGFTSYVWRPAVVAGGVCAGVLAHRWNALPITFAVAFALVALRVAAIDSGSGNRFTPHDMTWLQALADIAVAVALVGVLVLSLRARRGALGRRELLDGVTVAVGAGLAAWLTLANPALESGTEPTLAVIASVYFPAAIMLVTFAAELMLDGLGRNRAMWFVMAAVIVNLGGTVLRALLQAEVVSRGWLPLLSASFVVAFLLLCAAISHPDAPMILHPLVRPADTSPPAHRETIRMAPLMMSLAVPIVLVAVVSPSSGIDMTVRTASTLTLVAAIVARLYVALDSHSRAQQALVDRLNRDELTNLLTRPRFVEHVAAVLDATWRSEHHATLIQINVDRFKNINDTLGHDAANGLLVVLAERLRATAEGFGAILARSGGDDFVIVDASTRTREDADERVEQVRSVFTRPCTVGESSFFVTASIGVVTAPRNRTISAEELMRRADIATHRAKTDGRNRVIVFDESMQSLLAQRMDVEHALHGAIGRQEMQLYHQPIVDIVTGQLSGFEALLRWRRGDGPIVSPADFIPIAEETGLINEIGAWALHEALNELRGWIDDGVVAPNATTSVNVSPRQIADPNFAEIVRHALESSGVPAHLLWLEMTESMMLDEPDLAQTTLRQVRAMGVRLALDDFGTGYSSLSLLQQFPIQRIKIDRAFVQGIADRSHDRSLVRTIIAMAQSMGLDLVAEGVESVHQLRSLRELGCDKAQGYLISRPVPADAMRSTMVALDELASLSLFASVESARPVAGVPYRQLEPVGAGGVPLLGRHLTTRPMA